jgi:ATP-binding cassette subfamily C (CFTR/MRP) protein 4
LDYSQNIEDVKREWESVKNSPNPNIFFAVWRSLRKEFIIAVIPGAISYNLGLATCILLKYIIDYVNGKIDNVILYLVLYAVIIITNLHLMSFSFVRCFIIVAKLKSIFTQIIYEKTLKVNYEEITQGSQSGKILSLISSDIEFLEGITFFPFSLGTPFFLIGSAVILWFNLGVAGLIGILVAVLHLPFTIFFSKKFGKLKFQTAFIGDSRMKMIGNLIEGINIVKFYAWEIPYLKNLLNKRSEEIGKHKKKSNFTIINKSSQLNCMGLTLFVTFTVYVLLGNSIDPSTAFPSIALLILSINSIFIFGSVGMSQIFLFKASCQRITNGLLLKEKAQTFNLKNKKKDLTLKKCTFSWKESNDNGNSKSKLIETSLQLEKNFNIALKKINFTANKGELIIVVGAVGSGKSALLLGILQEIQLSKGDLGAKGEVALVSDSPWIVSGTIKENILMGKEEDISFYDEVIEYCCLDKDLENFTNYGDLTIVGDRGITLSGGQKARISLARAVYAQKDIILIDDVLSAVDPEICFGLFEKCIKGLLKEKVVILATHQTQFASQADKILILENGEQLFFGTFDEVVEHHLTGYLGSLKQTQQKEKVSSINETKYERKLKRKDSKSFKAEESAKGNVPMKMYFKFLILGFNNSIFLILGILLQLLAQVSYMSIIYWIARWSNSNDQENMMFIYVMAILVGILIVLSFSRIIFIVYPLINAAEKLHNLAIKSLTLTKSVFFDMNPTGRLLNRFAKDTGQMDEVLILFFIESVISVSIILGNLITVVIIFPYIAILFAAVLIYFFLVMKIFNPALKRLKRMEQLSKSPLISLVNSTISGLTTIRSLNLEEKQKFDMKRNIEVNFKAYLSYQLMIRSIQLYLEYGVNLLAFLNIIILIQLRDSIDPSLAGMSISVTITIMGYTGYMFKVIIETDNFMTAVQRLFDYATLEEEGALELNPNFKITEGKIEVKNLSMKYRHNFDYSLKDLNFTINPGTKAGIVGRTGSGKSTIMQVLFRLTNPCEGSIFIDGQDYLKAGLHDLRKQMSVIPQSATLFIASLRDNLDPFHNFTDDEILNVLKITKLDLFFESLPHGLESQIGSDGISLSSGQKQLICLARAILGQRKIIVIDEATSNTDSQTDEFIQKQLRKKFKGSTMIVIAHRMRTIVDCQLIIVMDAGEVLEQGVPKDLLRNQNSAFSVMIEHTGPEESKTLKKRIRKS